MSGGGGTLRRSDRVSLRPSPGRHRRIDVSGPDISGLRRRRALASWFETREDALLTMRVCDLILRSIAKRCVSKDAAIEVENTLFAVMIGANK
jgi:hypothetical protein